jgi:hypothetical protein
MTATERQQAIRECNPLKESIKIRGHLEAGEVHPLSAIAYATNSSPPSTRRHGGEGMTPRSGTSGGVLFATPLRYHGGHAIWRYCTLQ